MPKCSSLGSTEIKQVFKFILAEVKEGSSRDVIIDVIMTNYMISLDYANALIDVCCALKKELVYSQRGCIGNSGW